MDSYFFHVRETNWKNPHDVWISGPLFHIGHREIQNLSTQLQNGWKPIMQVAGDSNLLWPQTDSCWGVLSSVCVWVCVCVCMCVCVCVCVCVCGGGQSLSGCPLESPPVEGEWPVVVRPFLSSKKWAHFKTRKSLRKKKNVTMGSDGTWKQNWLCWRRPARIYPPYLTDRRTMVR
jgi:hypothetical protein